MSLQLSPYKSYFDKSFRESQTRNYSLSIQLNVNELVFSIYNIEKNKFIALEAYRFSDNDEINQIPSFMGKILNNRPAFAFPYNSVYVIYQNTFSTLIPLPLFEEDKKNLYLGFNQPFQEDSRIVFDTLKNNDAVNVYYMPNMVAGKIRDFWPNANILHFSTALIESVSVNYKNKASKNNIMVNVRDNCFDILYFVENKLKFYNTFDFRTKEDFIYFLLITIDQLGLNPESVELLLSGEIDSSDENYSMIREYIKNYKFIDRNNNFGYSYVLDEIMFHKYYTLFNSLQCE